eukprot:462883-Pyramimonas_sp.AAC.1
MPDQQYAGGLALIGAVEMQVDPPELPLHIAWDVPQRDDSGGLPLKDAAALGPGRYALKARAGYHEGNLALRLPPAAVPLGDRAIVQ